MSSLASQTFRTLFGKAAGRQNPPDVRLVEAGLDPDLPGGRFKNGFLDFFMGWYDDILPALKQWSFVVPSSTATRTVLCRNAHGVSVLAELDGDRRISLFDPVEVTYTELPVTLATFVSKWLFTERAAFFLDDSVWRAWRRTNKRRLPIDEGLLAMVPIPAGGEWTLDNFQVEPFAPWLKQMGKVLQKGLGARSRAR